MAARSVFHCLECTKCVGGWGFAPDPTGGAYSAPPDPYSWWGGGLPPPPKNNTPALGPSGLDPRAYGARPRRLRRLEPNPPVNIPQFSHWTFVFECRSPLPSEPVAVSVSDVSNALMTTATAADPVAYFRSPVEFRTLTESESVIGRALCNVGQ